MRPISWLSELIVVFGGYLYAIWDVVWPRRVHQDVRMVEPWSDDAGRFYMSFEGKTVKHFPTTATLQRHRTVHHGNKALIISKNIFFKHGTFRAKRKY